MTKVTRSMGRKLSHQAHGGAAYETTDIWVTLEEETDDPKATSQKLYKLGKAELEQAISDVKEDIANDTE